MTETPPTHRERLIEHFASFSASERESFAQIYGTGSTPRALTDRFIENASEVREIIARELPEESDARRLMEDLAYDHDLFVDISWSGRGPRRRLFELGLTARPRPGDPAHQLEMVGAIAGVVAPLLPGMATTAVTLLGARQDDYIDSVAAAWDITAPSLLEKVLRVSQHLAAPERADDLVTLLGAGDYVGAALMALELGGVCFWQEVFGHDLDQNPEFGGNVVALMRSDERDYERHIADTLVDHGVLFRVEAEGRAPLAVVPEELWSTLWQVGRAWMMEWTAVSFADLQDGAARKALDGPMVDYQSAVKWFVCEADQGTLSVAEDGLTDASIDHLVNVGGHDHTFWAHRARLAMEISALRPRRSGKIVEDPTFQRVLELPRNGFVRQVLFDWCTGYVGFEADRPMARALALDDDWRREVLNLLESRSEFIPLWMRHEGVEARITGCGHIRNAEDSTSGQLVMETALTNGLVWSAKLVWLDLLSMLEPQMWYPRSLLIDLLQLVTGFAVFSQLTHVLEEPNMGYYLPVQRASLLSDEYSVSQFTEWFEAILDGLFVPLGIAIRAEGDPNIWLDTAGMRIESPPGLSDDIRQVLMQEIFDNPDISFDITRTHVNPLRRIDEAPRGNSIELDRPLQAIRAWLGGREIARFDGRKLFVQD